MDYVVTWYVKDTKFVREWGPFTMKMEGLPFGANRESVQAEAEAVLEDIIKEGLEIGIERVEEVEEE